MDAARDRVRAVARWLFVALLIAPLASCGFAAGTGTSRESSACLPPPAANGALVLVGHTGAIRALAWSPNAPAGGSGHTFASAGGDGTVRLWSADGTPIRTLAAGLSGVRSVSWSPDGQTIAVGTVDDVRFYRVDGAEVGSAASEYGVGTIAYAPGAPEGGRGRTLALGTLNGRVELRQADGRFRSSPGGQGGRIEALAWSPDGTRLVSGATDSAILLWADLASEPKALREHRGAVQGLAWRADGSAFASASYDGTIRLWSPTGAPIATFQEGTASVNAVAFSPDGGTLAAGSHDRVVRLWSADGVIRETLSGHADVVSAVAWSTDGRTIASGSFDCTIRLWAR